MPKNMNFSQSTKQYHAARTFGSHLGLADTLVGSVQTPNPNSVTESPLCPPHSAVSSDPLDLPHV